MTTPYYGGVNRTLLRYVPLTARRVLELGCGEGSLGEAYKQRNPRARYTGVEMHPPAADAARARLDRLFAGAFEDIDDAELRAE